MVPAHARPGSHLAFATGAAEKALEQVFVLLALRAPAPMSSLVRVEKRLDLLVGLCGPDGRPLRIIEVIAVSELRNIRGVPQHAADQGNVVFPSLPSPESQAMELPEHRVGG